MTIKRLLWLIAITTLSLGAHAQHFDWAKGFASSQGGGVKGFVTDADGNLYIIGWFTKDATWDGHRILPIAPYGPGQNSINTLIAKISPSGEMLWKKVIHSNNSQNTIPYDIKPIGDTAFACMVEVNLPTSDHYCYFLDTLLPSWSDYPIPLSVETTTVASFTAYMVFGFSGNVLEQHFIQVSYIDTTGNDYVFHYSQPNMPDKLFSYPLTDPSFDVDADGNIYICRQSADHFDNMISVEEGSAIGLKFWVDKQCVGTVYVNDGSHPRWVPQMLKFSPHMAALLRSRYVFQNDDARYHMVCHMYYKMELDRHNNVYTICTLSNDGSEPAGTLEVDSLQGIRHWYPERTNEIGALVKFDSNLEPGWIVALDDSILNPTSGHSRTLFHDISFDYDSNLLFLSVTSCRGTAIDTTNFHSIPMYDGTPIPVKNEAFVLVLEQTAGKPAFHSYGRVPSVNSSDFNGDSKRNLVCKNNRVFVQSSFSGGIRFPGNEILYNRMMDFSNGLIVFDYGGTVIDGISYETSSPNTHPGPLSLSDSVLYLSILLSGDTATFGEYTLSTTGKLACVARYTDTSFMRCYVRPNPPVNISETENPQLGIYPNPTTNSLTINSVSEQITGIAVYSASGTRADVSVDGTTINTAHLMPGIYILEITTKENKYHQKFIKQ